MSVYDQNQKRPNSLLIQQINQHHAMPAGCRGGFSSGSVAGPANAPEVPEPEKLSTTEKLQKQTRERLKELDQEPDNRPCVPNSFNRAAINNPESTQEPATETSAPHEENNESVGNAATISPDEESTNDENAAAATTADPDKEDEDVPVCPICKKNHEFIEKGKEGTNKGNGQTLRENIIGPVENHRWYTGAFSLEAHHLIPTESLKDDDWEEYCRMFRYNINHKNNGVMLPYDMNLACQLHVPIHRSNHKAGRAEGVRYVEKIISILDEEKEKIKLGDYCAEPKELVEALDDFSEFILKKINAFEWTITRDGKDYADGQIGCAGVTKSITNKPNKPCPHDRKHGLAKQGTTNPLPKSGPLKIGH